MALVKLLQSITHSMARIEFDNKIWPFDSRKRKRKRKRTQLKLNADPNVMIHLKLFVYLFSNPFEERRFSEQTVWKPLIYFKWNSEQTKILLFWIEERKRGRQAEWKRMVSLCFIIYLMCLNQHCIENSDRIIIRENEEDKSKTETETNTLRVVPNEEKKFLFHSVFFSSIQSLPDVMDGVSF